MTLKYIVQYCKLFVKAAEYVTLQYPAAKQRTKVQRLQNSTLMKRPVRVQLHSATHSQEKQPKTGPRQTTCTDKQSANVNADACEYQTHACLQTLAYRYHKRATLLPHF